MSKTGPSRKRLRLAIKLAVAAVCLAWFARYAYVRITTKPGDAQAVAVELAARLWPDLEEDASLELTRAMAALPFPPAGITDVNLGPWDPEGRPQLRVAISYLTASETNAALERIRSLRGRPWRCSFVWRLEPQVNPMAYQERFFRTAAVLVARARYRHAALRDQEGAWEDLKTVLLLGRDALRALAIDTRVLLTAEALCFPELVHWSREATLGDSLAREIDAVLAGLPSCEAVWTDLCRNAAEFGRCFRASFFTDDPRGNGWLVLSEGDARIEQLGPISFRGPALEKRSRVWNVASILFNDRKTVEGKGERYLRRMEELGRLPYAAGEALARKLGEGHQIFNVLDGPHIMGMSAGGWHLPQWSDGLLRGDADRRATRLTIAVHRFRSAHGRYPESLTELVPDFISELPDNPYCGGPYEFRVESVGAVIVDSCYDAASRARAQRRLRLDMYHMLSAPQYLDSAGAELVAFNDVYAASRSESIMDRPGPAGSAAHSAKSDIEQ